MTGKEILALIADNTNLTIIITLLILSLVQISPLRINPWTWLASKISRLFVGDLVERVDRLTKDVTSLRNECSESTAISSRVRILAFADDITHGVTRSEESYKQVFDDITRYNKYCSEHPEFKNDMTVTSCEIIKEKYKMCIQAGSFC